MAKIIKGVLIDTQNNNIQIIDFEEKNYKSFYKLLNCNTIEIVTRKFGEHTLDIVCDEEGLFKEERIVSIITKYGEDVLEQLVGNAFICSHNEEGELTSLNDSELESVLNCGMNYLDEKNIWRMGLIAHV